ncbi:sugar ABC transporter ATP-binding protein [Streptomyces halstedii]|uniref:sugar ABC transporter ATP-binding protein n=1 Tax=Streptomyces TaxID=1883 RepID=UPI00048CDF2B|nr:MULTISPECIES: sugar ABC transporter ATP-binding protein [unclassified Streptomyces]MYY16386.1 ATP-binding cassette domain-containing protein [Streptomyces sp. SID4912]SCD76378.1 ribose transport system ATP-binding protein [Streptomyces sp. PpalLS-921]SCD83016.1 ribose transport system ATP-binding protein [Streptomyces sp. DpondAA-D4]
MSATTTPETARAVDRPVAEPVVRVRDLTKSFGGAVALRGASLDIRAGEVHALMGMNGAGKSTLVQLLSGAHQGDGGTIEIGGTPHSGLTARKARQLGISTVPQRRELVMTLTVAENILLGDLPAARSVVSWKSVERQARQALLDLDLDIDVKRTAGELTVAEQTMVEVAREVRRGGKVLILDEPTACLGAAAADQIRTLVRTLRDEGVAVVYISHYIDEVLSLADHVTVLRDGSVVHSGPAAETDSAGLVRHMVGRDVVSRRPERPAPAPAVALSVRGLSHGRDIADFGVQVRQGEIVGVLGPAGDAQSRLFDLLSGRRRPDAGEMEVGGAAVPFGDVARSLAGGLRCVTGDRRALGLIPGLTVDENIMLATDRLGRRRLQRRADMTRRAAPRREAYGVVSLTPNPVVAGLSGGNQQKVLLAKWLETSPVACFLEDPTNGVDVSAMADIHALIDDLASRGVAVLLASSSAEEVMRLSDRVIVVSAGRVVAEHDVSAITRDELVATALGGQPR